MKIVKPLTKDQRKALEFIVRFIELRGISPTLQNIADGLGGKSLATAQHYVAVLEDKGYLRKSKHKTRGLIPTGPTSPTIMKVGYIAAGNPIEPIEEPMPVMVPRSFLEKAGQYYALEVKGDSMQDDGIWDGDLIVVRHQFQAEQNDVVVAITENGATLKVLKYKENGKQYLQPRNSKYAPIYPENLEIRGRLVGIVHHEE